MTISIDLDLSGQLWPSSSDEITWFPRELLALRPPSRMSVTQWADQRRVLQHGVSRQPGPWSTTLTPYLQEPMDAFSDPGIRHIVLCFGTQLGKTECLFNCLGWCVDLEPFPTMLIHPREDDCKTISRTRLQPMIEDCECLRRKKPGRASLYQTLEMHFLGMPLYLCGANSAASLAQKPCRNILRDEIDKYPVRVGKDADPLSLSEERAKSFWDIRKVFDVSSPTFENWGISAQLQACDEIRDYHVVCPLCGAYQILVFPQIKWDTIEGEEDQDRIARARRTARYVCSHCGGELGDEYKARMLESGRWVAERKAGYEIESVGFNLSSLYSPWLGWGDIAEKFLKAQKEAKMGNKQQLQNFVNGWLAEPWKEHESQRKDEDLFVLKEDKPRGLVPSEGVLALTAGVDTQDNGFFFVVRAWGENLESWLIREGFLENFQALDFAFWGSIYRDAAGKGYVLPLIFIDSGGHRTSEVYGWCRERQEARPVKGFQRMTSPHSISRIDTWPGTNNPIPGGVSLIRLNVSYYKNWLATKLRITPGDPGAFHLHGEVPEEYFKQMTAEYVDDDGLWQCPQGKANHYWDCEVMALAAADMLGLQYLKKTREHKVQQPRVPSLAPGWVIRDSGSRSWLRR